MKLAPYDVIVNCRLFVRITLTVKQVSRTVKHDKRYNGIVLKACASDSFFFFEIVLT